MGIHSNLNAQNNSKDYPIFLYISKQTNKQTNNTSMKPILLFLALNIFTLQAQLLQPLPNHLNKRLLIAHPTKGTIEIIYALHKHNLVDFSKIQLTGVFHKNEVYNYGASQEMLDTMAYLNMTLVEIKDTLTTDNLFKQNECSDDFIALFKNSIGAIFFGGPDIPPAIYNEKPHPRTRVTDPFRHYFEASFIHHLLGGYQNKSHKGLLVDKNDYLIMGFCLGMQTMNVATGGTMIQDIPSEIFNSSETEGLMHLDKEQIHRNYYPHMRNYQNKGLSSSTFHAIKFTNKYFANFNDIAQDSEPLVNSYHHQAVEKLGKGFKVCASSADRKIIEAIYHKRYPHVFGVQFHPERTQFYLKTKYYQFTPNGESKKLPEWIDEESMQFHLDFWQGVNSLLKVLQQ